MTARKESGGVMQKQKQQENFPVCCCRQMPRGRQSLPYLTAT